MKKIVFAIFIVVSFLLVGINFSYAKPKAKEIGPLFISATDKANEVCWWNSSKGKWLSALKNKKGKYLTLKAYKKAKRKAVRSGNSAQVTKYTRKIKKLKKVFKQHCKLLTSAPSTEVSSLSQVPSTASALAAGSSSTSSFNLFAVDGTPPTLTSISSNGNADEAFWASGVIDGLSGGNPSADQCNEFWGGGADGTSGGFGACGMASALAQSFGPIEQAGVSTCYMRSFPTQANVNAGGVSLVSGSWPGGSVENLFDTPSSGESDRLVQVQITGNGEDPKENMTVYIKVYSEDSNSSSGDQYAADLWFCDQSSSSPVGFEQIRIDTNNTFTSTMGDSVEELMTGVVTGKLTVNNSGFVIFDTSQDRTATVNFEDQQNSFSFKGDITFLGGQNQMAVKSYDVFDSSGSGRLAYTVANYTGTELSDARFTEGAFKERNLSSGGQNAGEQSAATEYRESAGDIYVSAPSNSLLTSVNTIDFDTDSFYSSPPSVSYSPPSGMVCTGLTPDVVVSIDMSNTSVQNSVSDCEPNMDTFDICFGNQNIQNAMNVWFNSCQQ